MGHNLGDGQHHYLAIAAQDAIRKFGSFEKTLNHHFIVVDKSVLNGTSQLIGGIDFRSAVAAAVFVGFDKHGNAHGFQLGPVDGLSFAQHFGWRHWNIVAAQKILTSLFVERNGTGHHLAARVGNAQHLKVAL